MSMSPLSFIFVLALMWLPVIAIYVTLFSVGSGFGADAEKSVPLAKSESKPEPREIRHAA